MNSRCITEIKSIGFGDRITCRKVSERKTFQRPEGFSLGHWIDGYTFIRMGSKENYSD